MAEPERAAKKRKLNEAFQAKVKQVNTPLTELSMGDLKLAPHDSLQGLERQLCPKCNRKRKYFCYDCFLAFSDPAALPNVQLPIHCEVVHYPTETTAKSTAIHCKMIAPETTSIHEFPDHPAFDPAETVLLFPSDDATPISELDISKVKRVVFIDSQWNRVNRILPDEKLARLPKVKITSYKTHFWRYQQEGADCLSTIEAIYHFYREFRVRAEGSYNGEYDNLLWYFSFFHGLIQNHYKTKQMDFPRIKGWLGDPNSHSAPVAAAAFSSSSATETPNADADASSKSPVELNQSPPTSSASEK